MTNKMTMISPEDKKMCDSLFWRFNWVRLFGNKINSNGCGFLFAMEKCLQEYYKDDPEGLQDAYNRHIEYFNSHSMFCHFLGGVAAGMEKEKVQGKCDAAAISAVKSSLMGPLAGIGDSFFYTAYRPIIAGICMGLAATGNILAPILFILLFSVPQQIGKYYILRAGFVYGADVVNKTFESGLLNIITRCCGFVGMAMLGVMVASSVKVNIALAPVLNGAEINIQQTLDSIYPGLLSLLVFFAVYKAVKKKVNPITICFVMIGIGIVLAFLGVI